MCRSANLSTRCMMTTSPEPTNPTGDCLTEAELLETLETLTEAELREIIETARGQPPTLQ